MEAKRKRVYQTFPCGTVFLLLCETCQKIILDTLTHPKVDSTIWTLAILQFESHKKHFNADHLVLCVEIALRLSYPAKDLYDPHPWPEHVM